MENRRQFLAKAAMLSGAAGFSGGLLGSIRQALAIEPEPNSTFRDAEHVVILMQENRSFDHAFGTLRGVRGFNDPRAITLPDGNPVWVQTNPTGESYVPFRLDIKNSSATWMGSLPHGRTDQVDARNHGKYDRWLHVKRLDGYYADMPFTLGYYTREDIPFYYELADAFTICDQHFCSSLTPTTPNRCYLWSGTIRAEQNAESPANVLNSDADHYTNVSWPTFPERLEDLGVSWKVYQNEINVGVGFTGEEDAWLSNFGDNPLEYFTQFNVRLTPAHRQYLEERAKSLPQEIAALKHDAAAKNISKSKVAELAEAIAEKEKHLRHIEHERRRWNQAVFDKLSPREKSLMEKAFTSNTGDPLYRQLTDVIYHDGDKQHQERAPKGDLLHQFRRDVEEGKLPTVSWLVPPEKFSDHPGSAWYGAWYIAEVMDILTHNPEVWKKTIFILTYDENDGYFDHVPPFVAPDPRRPETGHASKNIDTAIEYVTLESELKRKARHDARDSPIGLGYRVPLVIASPWTRGGYVCSQVFDHTSTLQFLEKFLMQKLGKEVRETNISQWRRTVCGDLTSAFQDDATELEGYLSFPERDAFIEQIHRAQFKQVPTGYERLSAAAIESIRRDSPASAKLPQQEPGIRPSCALPYELAVEGKLSDDGRSVAISLDCRRELFGKAAAGAPFTVYARRGPDDVQVRNYAVSPGDQLEDSWSLRDFANERYHLAAYGPNGFYREFRGDANDPRVEVSCNNRKLSANASARALEITIHNRDGHACVVHLKDLGYGSASQRITASPGQVMTFSVDCERSFGWYDFSISAAGNEKFSRRYAGRVETGKPSFSDPVMGRIAI